MQLSTFTQIGQMVPIVPPPARAPSSPALQFLRAAQAWLIVRRRRLNLQQQSQAPRPVPAEQKSALLEQERALRRDMVRQQADQLAQGRALPLDRLADAFGLTWLEQRLVLVAAAHGLRSARDAAEFPGLQTYVLDVQTLCALAAERPADQPQLRTALGANGALHRRDLLDIQRDCLGGLRPGAHVQIGAQALAILSGLSYLDAALTDFCCLEPKQAGADPQQPWPRAPPLALSDHACRLLLLGQPGAGKTEAARAVAGQLGLSLIHVRMCQLLNCKDFDQRLPCLFRQARLHQALLLVHLVDGPLQASCRGLDTLGKLIQQHDMPMVFSGIGPQDWPWQWPTQGLCSQRVEVPDPGIRQRIWEIELGAQPWPVGLVNTADLANAFALTPSRIAQAVAISADECAQRQGPWAVITHAALARASRAVAAEPQTGGNAGQYIDYPIELLGHAGITQSLEALVRCCSSHVQAGNAPGGPRRAQTALICGDTGTGKTLTAEVIAARLHRPLRVATLASLEGRDLADTDRNLREFFGQARATAAVVLLEGCAGPLVARAGPGPMLGVLHLLLGFLAQFDGIALLTAPAADQLAPRLRLRMDTQLTLTRPEGPVRTRIWQSLLRAAGEEPTALDCESLGTQFPLTGGQIRNAVIIALQQSRGTGQRLGLEDLRHAARQVETGEM